MQQAGAALADSSNFRPPFSAAAFPTARPATTLEGSAVGDTDSGYGFGASCT